MDSTWLGDLLRLLSVPALVLLNAVFVAGEFALVAVRKTQVEEMVRLGRKGAKQLDSAIKRLDRSIAATQLGITLASIGLGWVGEPALARLIRPLFHFLNDTWLPIAAHSTAALVAFLFISYLHMAFGELVPKSLAIRAPDRIALWFAAPLLVFAKLTRPFTLIISGTANLVLRLMGSQPGSGEEGVHSVEELLLLIEDSEEAGMLDADQADLVENVFHLSRKRVRDCMVPRDKMASLEISLPHDKVLEAVRSGAHTRMPVYEGNPDNIVGIVNTKNLFFLFSLKGVVVLEDAMYPPLFLKPDESVATALRLFRNARRPMALVRGDDGKILGLITLEDVLEEIVGDIEDEHDRPPPKVKLRRRLQLPRPAVPGPARPAPGMAKGKDQR
ncbi:MAG TPA: hemolysin family protein [Gemmataceae bacterium]|nr:hemolysin family protein [Gemmataceae bacterium]